MCCSTSTAHWRRFSLTLGAPAIACTRTTRSSRRVLRTNGRSGSLQVGRRLSTLPPLRPKSQNYWSRRQLDDELRRRAFAGTLSPPYVTSSFSLEDWDFDESLWQHWATLAHEDSALWGRLVERILSQPDTYTTKAKTARALQTATTGNTKPATYDPIVPAWILKLRELPCLRDTRGTYRKPGELLRRTPQTEPFLDIEFFVHALLDVEAARPLLGLLGVRDTPTTPDRLINCLRALAVVDKPPVAEVEKWYRRLDQMLDTASTTEATKIQNAFQHREADFHGERRLGNGGRRVLERR